MCQLKTDHECLHLESKVEHFVYVWPSLSFLIAGIYFHLCLNPFQKLLTHYYPQLQTGNKKSD